MPYTTTQTKIYHLIRTLHPTVAVSPPFSNGVRAFVRVPYTIEQQFYCLMNTWNESLASCSAPQENQYTVDALFPPPEPARSESDHDEDDAAAAAAGHGMNRRDGGDSDYEGGGRSSSMYGGYGYREYNHEVSPGVRHGASSRAGGRGGGRVAEREGWYQRDEYY